MLGTPVRNSAILQIISSAACGREWIEGLHLVLPHFILTSLLKQISDIIAKLLTGALGMQLGFPTPQHPFARMFSLVGSGG